MWPNKKIAEHFRITPERVSQVLNDPHAKAMIRTLQARMQERLADDIEGSLMELAKISVDRVGETIRFEDFSLGSDAKKHQDNLSMTLLKGVGFLPGPQEGKESARPPLNEALAERLIGALEKTNSADEMQGKIENNEVTVIEVDEVEIIDG
jgi:hypothetical protein